MSTTAAPSSDSPSDQLRLQAARTALLVVDVQERLAAVMDEQRMTSCQRNILTLIELCRQLGLPVIESQQVPGKLGPTVPAIAEALRGTGLKLHRLEKETFAVTDHPPFPDLFRQLNRSQWIVVGMESHICVFQSARGLRALGATVHLPADAIISRSPENHRIGIELGARAGAVPSSTETVAFDLLVKAGGDAFRAISRLVK